MREIIQLHIGQSGIQIGNAVWDLLCQEHSIQNDGTVSNPDQSNLQVLFSESSTRYQVPRAYFIDEDPTTINQIKRSQYRDLYHPNSLALIKTEIGGESLANIKPTLETSKGIPIVDQIYKLLEQSDSISTFVIYHALAGGAGTCLTKNLLEIFKDETAKTTLFTYSILPSKNDISVSPYNACFSLQAITQYSNFNILISNTALHNIAGQFIETPNYSNLNHMIAQTFASITSQIRYPGRNFIDFNTIKQNLVPSPREQFLWTAYSPWLPKDSSNKINVEIMTKSLFDSRGAYMDFNRLTNRYSGSNIFYRGDCPLPEVKDTIKLIKESPVIRFADERPQFYQASFCNNASLSIPKYEFGKTNKSACMLANSTAVLKPLINIYKDFKKLYSKRAFIHWYVGQGLEEGNFPEAQEDLKKTIEIYQKLHGDGKPVEDVEPEVEVKQKKQVNQQPKAQQKNNNNQQSKQNKQQDGQQKQQNSKPNQNTSINRAPQQNDAQQNNGKQRYFEPVIGQQNQPQSVREVVQNEQQGQQNQPVRVQQNQSIRAEEPDSLRDAVLRQQQGLQSIRAQQPQIRAQQPQTLRAVDQNNQNQDPDQI